MNHSRLEQGLATWQHDAHVLVSENRIPDPQVSITALVGVYVPATEVRQERTVHTWRQSVLADKATTRTLGRLLPDTADFFDVDESVDISHYRTQKQFRHQARTIGAAVLDGMPVEQNEITFREEYISCILGHAAYNYAIYFPPLGVDMDYARSPFRQFFPQTLKLIEQGVSV